jgi:DNA-binding NarL/FixJ family response regulator
MAGDMQEVASREGGGPDVLAPDHASSGRVLVVEEHALVADGLRVALSERRWSVETSTGSSEQEVLELAQRFQPQCVLLDLHLRNAVGGGIALITPLVATGSHVLVVTAERRRTVLAECLEAGAAGWIGPGVGIDEVHSTLGDVIAGAAIVGRTERAELLDRLRLERANEFRAQATFERLTQREALVLVALTEGLTAEEIAREHYVALATVRSQIRAVLQKLGVRTQLAAVALADDHRDLLSRQSSGYDRRREDRRGRRGRPDVIGQIA